MKTVIIFGGSGYVGQHLIRRIAKNGHKIIIPYQSPTNEANLRLLGSIGQIYPLKYRSIEDSFIINQINIADVIINLKTQWDERKTKFEVGILGFNKKITNHLKINNPNCHFVFFTGLGIDKNSKSKRSNSIFESEKYIQKNLSKVSIIRPSIILGGGDKFSKSLLTLFKMTIIIPLVGNGKSKFQPVYIEDVANGIDKIINYSTNESQIFEFTSNTIFSYKDFYSFIISLLNYKRLVISTPLILVKIGVFILEKISLSPVSSEQLKLFEDDNIASNKYKKLEDLGIKPQDIKQIVKKIVIKNS
tara:strand:- start:592 stop:1503 length:912 start_codon:yes stop_codon:yes gene_type:complete